MISAKEKAKELVNKFHDEIKYMERAKQCALITVNELIKETGSKYWYDVKKEIEKM
jgi:hypothetical protein